MRKVYLLFASSYPGACFASVDHAMRWVATRRVAGILLEFPLEVELVKRSAEVPPEQLPDAVFYADPALRRNTDRATAHWYIEGWAAHRPAPAPAPDRPSRRRIWVFVHERTSPDDPRSAADIDIIFPTKAKAEAWIRARSAAGLLTAYRVGGSAVELAALAGNESAKRRVARMSAQELLAESDTSEHWHYDNPPEG